LHELHTFKNTHFVWLNLVNLRYMLERKYDIDDGKDTSLCNYVTVKYSLLIFNLFHTYVS